RLLLQRLLVGRQQAEQVECPPFFLRERGPFVQQRAFEQQVPNERHLDGVDSDGVRQDRLDVHPSTSRCPAGWAMDSGPRTVESERVRIPARNQPTIQRDGPSSRRPASSSDDGGKYQRLVDRARVEAEAGDDSCARVVGAFGGHMESRGSLFTQGKTSGCWS